MSRKFLLEDLQPGDLINLVSPIIEIDTFKPRIDEQNIVVAFSVQEKNPAYDLSRFIEFTSNDVLDTEVGSYPNEHGNFWVFVEFTPTNIEKKIVRMLQAVQYLTEISEWTYKAYDRRGKLNVKRR